MTRRMWFLYFLKRSVWQRKGRVAVASFSVALASGLVVIAIGISEGIGEKLGDELKAYGANIMVAPREGDVLYEKDVLRLSGLGGVEEYTGQVYGRALLNKTEVEFMGLDFDRLKNWRVEGRRPTSGEALLGANLKEALKLRAAEIVDLDFEKGETLKLKVSGFIERGGPEDRAVLLSLGEAQRLSGLEGRLSAVLVRGKTEDLENTVSRIKEVLPDADVRTLRQVAHAEEAFLKKLKLLMLLVSLVVLPASAISVSSTMSATVLERTKEIGIMMSLGGTKKEIGFFYAAEAVLIGLAGGALGCMTGFLGTEAVSKGAFGSYVGMPLYALAVSIITGLFIAVFSSVLPLRAALGYRPSVILRGE